MSELTKFDDEELRLLPLPASCRLLAAESLLHVGRLADGRIIACTDYRLLLLLLTSEVRLEPVFVQPLGCITRLTIGPEVAQLRLSFTLLAAPLSLQFRGAAEAAIWAEQLDPARPASRLLRRRRQSAASSLLTALIGVGDDDTLTLLAGDDDAELESGEMKRLGMTELTGWRLSEANQGYSLCASYARFHVVPRDLTDDELLASSKFRSRGRFPSVVWRCHANGAALARSGQPLVGLFGWRCEADEKLLALLGGCGKLLIADARTYRSALANRTVGGGFEYGSYYSNSEIVFLDLPNMHAIRQSFAAMQQRALAPDAVGLGVSEAEGDLNGGGGACLLGELERSRWLQHVSTLIGHARRLAAALTVDGRSVLVHCTDGWDRTPQLASLTLLLADPHYRSLAGLRTLLQREWLHFGHRFASRCGSGEAPDDPNEWSPIFVQFLDCLHQLIGQCPAEFEFTDVLLRRLAIHCYSGLFAELTCNSQAERQKLFEQQQQQSSLFQLFSLQGAKNLFYQPTGCLNQLDISLASLKIWSELYAPASQLRSASSGSGSSCFGSFRCDFDGLPIEIEPGQSQLRSLMRQLEECQLKSRQLRDQLNQFAASYPAEAAAVEALSQSPHDQQSLLPSLEIIEKTVARRCFTHWVPDHQRGRCAGCGAEFWLPLRRRHHCRACGDVFCHSCCSEYVRLPGQMLRDLCRVCKPCAAAAAASATVSAAGADPDSAAVKETNASVEVEDKSASASAAAAAAAVLAAPLAMPSSEAIRISVKS